jgi:hypothetical protein
LIFGTHFFGRNFDAHVAAGHHDAVAGVDDLVNVLAALGSI